MRKGRFAACVAASGSPDVSWVDMHEGVLVEREVMNASWSEVDMSDDVTMDTEDGATWGQPAVLVNE